MVNVTARCRDCGEPVLFDDGLPDEAMFVCEKCGLELGTYGEHKDAAEAIVRDALARAMKDMLKRG